MNISSLHTDSEIMVLYSMETGCMQTGLRHSCLLCLCHVLGKPAPSSEPRIT